MDSDDNEDGQEDDSPEAMVNRSLDKAFTDQQRCIDMFNTSAHMIQMLSRFMAEPIIVQDLEGLSDDDQAFYGDSLVASASSCSSRSSNHDMHQPGLLAEISEPALVPLMSMGTQTQNTSPGTVLATSKPDSSLPNPDNGYPKACIEAAFSRGSGIGGQAISYTNAKAWDEVPVTATTRFHDRGALTTNARGSGEPHHVDSSIQTEPYNHSVPNKHTLSSPSGVGVDMATDTRQDSSDRDQTQPVLNSHQQAKSNINQTMAEISKAADTIRKARAMLGAFHQNTKSCQSYCRGLPSTASSSRAGDITPSDTEHSSFTCVGAMEISSHVGKQNHDGGADEQSCDDSGSNKTGPPILVKPASVEGTILNMTNSKNSKTCSIYNSLGNDSFGGYDTNINSATDHSAPASRQSNTSEHMDFGEFSTDQQSRRNNLSGNEPLQRQNIMVTTIGSSLNSVGNENGDIFGMRPYNGYSNSYSQSKNERVEKVKDLGMHLVVVDGLCNNDLLAIPTQQPNSFRNRVTLKSFQDALNIAFKSLNKDDGQMLKNRNSDTGTQSKVATNCFILPEICTSAVSCDNTHSNIVDTTKQENYIEGNKPLCRKKEDVFPGSKEFKITMNSMMYPNCSNYGQTNDESSKDGGSFTVSQPPIQKHTMTQQEAAHVDMAVKDDQSKGESLDKRSSSSIILTPVEQFISEKEMKPIDANMEIARSPSRNSETNECLRVCQIPMQNLPCTKETGEDAELTESVYYGSEAKVSSSVSLASVKSFTTQKETKSTDEMPYDTQSKGTHSKTSHGESLSLIKPNQANRVIVKDEEVTENRTRISDIVPCVETLTRKNETFVGDLVEDSTIDKEKLNSKNTSINEKCPENSVLMSEESYKENECYKLGRDSFLVDKDGDQDPRICERELTCKQQEKKRVEMGEGDLIEQKQDLVKQSSSRDVCNIARPEKEKVGFFKRVSSKFRRFFKRK